MDKKTMNWHSNTYANFKKTYEFVNKNLFILDFMKYSAVKSLAGFSRSFSETKTFPSLIACASHCNLLFLQKLK